MKKFNELTEDEKYDLLEECRKTNSEQAVKGVMFFHGVDQSEFRLVCNAMHEFIEDQNNQNKLDRIRGK